jgi:hypothetical protein
MEIEALVEGYRNGNTVYELGPSLASIAAP